MKLWGSRFGRFSAHKELVAELLVEYFTRRGESVDDLPIDVDRDNVEAWTQEWRDKASDAGITGKSDIEAVVNMLKERSRLLAPGARHADAASRIVDSLTHVGATLPISAYSAVSKELQVSKKAADRSECTRPEAIMCIYFGIAGSASDAEWMASEMERVSHGDSGVSPEDDEDLAGINMRLCPSALKVFAKEPATPTLERVLMRGGEAMIDYFEYVVKQLTALNLPAAAQMFQNVVSYAVRKHKVDEKTQRQYLMRYFFTDYLGRGLVRLVARDSLNVVLANRGQGGAGGVRQDGAAIRGPEPLQAPGCLASSGAEAAMGQLVQLLAGVGFAGNNGTLGDVNDAGPQFGQYCQQQGGVPPPAGAAGSSGGVLPPGNAGVREFCAYCHVWHRGANSMCDWYQADTVARRKLCAEAQRKRADAERAERIAAAKK